MSNNTSKTLSRGLPRSPTLCSIAPRIMAQTAVPSMLMLCVETNDSCSAKKKAKLPCSVSFLLTFFSTPSLMILSSLSFFDNYIQSGVSLLF